VWHLRALATQILVSVLGILVLTVALGGFLFLYLSARGLDNQYEQRAVAIANTVAEMPSVQAGVMTADPQHRIEALAQNIVNSTGASYVVITNRAGIRYSHPDQTLIGKRLQEGVTVLDGRDHVGIDKGDLGRSANGRVPIFGAGSTVIGEVSVGVLESRLSGQRHREEFAIVAYSAAVLALGVLASWLLARRIKRVTFGLELTEIASLLQEREAMLHGIREGVVGFDAEGKVTLINQEAQRLLNCEADVVGRAVDALAEPGRLCDLLSGGLEGIDEVAITDEFLLVVNRMPVVVAGRLVGSVVTLRDRSELESLIRELRSVNALTSAMRAQEHEYANRLHVMSGLLEMGEQEEAARYLAEISQTSLAQAENLRARIAPPVLAALLVAKITVATEQGIRLAVTDESHLDLVGIQPLVVQTVLGNLIDNAIEAVGGTPEPREITVHLDDSDGVYLSVVDSGPGLEPEQVQTAFIDGYSTKTTRSGVRRGLGLALVHRIVRRAGGTITAHPGPGGRFEVRLPGLASNAPDGGHEAADEQAARYVPTDALT